MLFFSGVSHTHLTPHTAYLPLFLCFIRSSLNPSHVFSLALLTQICQRIKNHSLHPMWNVGVFHSRCYVLWPMRCGAVHVESTLHHLPGRLDQHLRRKQVRRMHPRKICQCSCLCFVRSWNVWQTKFGSKKSHFRCRSLRRLPGRNVFVGQRCCQRHRLQRVSTRQSFESNREHEIKRLHQLQS